MKVDRKHFISVLQSVQPAVASKELVEQSTSFIFTGSQVMAYDDELCISHPLETEFECAVLAKELLAVLLRIKDEEVDVQTNETHLVVKGKKNKAGIKLEWKTNVEEISKTLGMAKDWNALPNNFMEGLGFCALSVGKDNSKPLSKCIHCHGNSMLSTDNRRITVYYLQAIPDTGMEELNIPGSAVRALSSFDLQEYALSDGWVHFKAANDAIVSSRTIAGKFPREKAFEFIAKAQRAENDVKMPSTLPEMLKAASVFTSSSTTGAKKSVEDSHVQISINSGLLTVRGEGPAGFFEESARCKYQGDAIEFECVPDFLNKILAHTDTAVVDQGSLLFEGDNFEHIIRTFAKSGRN